MGKSQETYNKKQKEKKRLKKRQDKQQRKEERKANSEGGGLDNMIAYVDEFGNISDTPPEKVKKEVSAESIEIGVPKREDMPEKTHFEGKVTYFNDAKGFGFIHDSETQEKYFVHINGTLEPISVDDKVGFELERGNQGMVAVNVKKL